MFGKIKALGIRASDRATHYTCSLCAWHGRESHFFSDLKQRLNVLPLPAEEGKSQLWEPYCPQCFKKQWFKRWLMCRFKFFTLTDENGSPYMRRYFIYRGRFNIFIHEFLRSDRDTFHDHPWDFLTLILSGGYLEHQPESARWYGPGSILFRRAETQHKVELAKPCRVCRPGRCPSVSSSTALDKNCIGLSTVPAVWTLCLTGRKRREWGFMTLRGWMSAKRFIAEKFKGRAYEEMPAHV